MKFPRSSGILMHPTSFPGRYGIGDLGPQAYRFIDFLYTSGTKLWQILPLGPTGYGDSPYQSFSAFAGNPYLISPDLLLDENLLHTDDLAGKLDFTNEQVDFGRVIGWKLNLLERAFIRFKREPELASVREAYLAFCADSANWLDDYALFMAIKEANGGGAWSGWSDKLKNRDDATLAEASQNYKDAIERFKFYQFIFFRQWDNLHAYAKENGIRIIGDIPIFVAFDSADVWSNPELFYLDDKKLPTVVAGVPPDYFAPTGQLWGNPLYKWSIHKETRYAWWIERFQAMLELVDIVRLDHFRGFAGYWEVAADSLTAEYGRWVPGPADDFFAALRGALGELPIIAEDLGEITPDVFELRDDFNLPGMRIAQFGFSDEENEFLPQNYPENCVAYTGTHDNDTVQGWYVSAPEEQRDFARRHMGVDGSEIAWDLIDLVWRSKADMVLAQMQDLLNLGMEARMNYPGRLGGNWGWRMNAEALTKSLIERLRKLNEETNR